MTATEQVKLRVAIASGSEQQRDNLKSILEKGGLQVVVNRPPNDQFLILIDSGQADVLLLDLNDETEQELSFIELLLERSTLPMLFNDSASTRMDAAAYDSAWGKNLARKLIALAEIPRSAQQPAPAQALNGAHTTATTAEITAPAVRMHTPARPAARKPAKIKSAGAGGGAARQVWVLGASIGGPQALKIFLSAIPEELPAAFVVAQHIGAGFAELLAEQLNAISPFQVLIARPGHLLRHRQVVLAPVEEQLGIDAQGQLVTSPAVEGSGLYRPSIDAVMAQVAQRYGARAGAIIFSGMGDDGVKGSRAIIEHGGAVWAQDGPSCMISSMPDNTRKAVPVSFNGTPEALAKRLALHFGYTLDKDGHYIASNTRPLQ